MQALSDEQHLDAIEAKVDRLEKKVDDGFAEVRSEIGALYRLMIQCFAGLGLTMILGFAGILLQQHI